MNHWDSKRHTITSRDLVGVYWLATHHRPAKWYNIAWWLDHTWGLILGIGRRHR